MSPVGDVEFVTQREVIRFFRETLGYDYLGMWKEREGNANVEEDMLAAWLSRRGYTKRLIDKALFDLAKAKALGGSKILIDANREVYELLRYGVKVKEDAGEHHKTVHLVDWKTPANNHFAIAEEVTITGQNTKRPDIVLYLNGIAVGVLELKRSTVSVSEGIRQNLDNQKKMFIRDFFSTIQLVMAGNVTEGLRYGVIETPEKYFLQWKEEGNRLETGLAAICGKERLLEIIHDFMVFDAGVKKTCRHNQYFGVRAAQAFARRREGGVIWHTQGSGKSLTMVWLAKWIRENIPGARVLIITDRTELDEQIEKVFLGVAEHIRRTKSGADLVQVLNGNADGLVCSLVHKFGTGDEGDIDNYMDDLRSRLPKDFSPKGELFVFIDECHRTQSGKLHDAMKAILPGATMFGFTGTPLLKKDKQKSIEVFGPYIHTYKYDEAVRDGVVLDLRYEARDIDQYISSQEKVDQWFDVKTQGLNDYAKAQLKQRWGTMQKVLSSQDRLSKIVTDILFDMETRDRLVNGRGNAMLVCGSIYQACKVFEIFQGTELNGKCAIVTSYKPNPGDIKGEETGEGLTEKLRQYETYRKMLAKHFDLPEDQAVKKVDDFEKEVKERFIKYPGQMRLLIVVDKLLTGFDAPPATYLYIDKQMQDHALFQAICRVNRLDGDDKEYGYIVDYKDLFKSLAKSIKEYTAGAFEAYDPEDVVGLLTDRLEKALERLENAREAIKALCEPVEPPYDTPDYLRYFCGGPKDEQKRVTLYKLTASLVRAYANIANEMVKAGYTEAQAQAIKAEVAYYEKVRLEVKLSSGDYIDMKIYEPAMRHLLDAYIRAEESEKLSTFDDIPLVQLIVERGEEAVESLPEGIRKNEEAVAETIENNVRKVIIDEKGSNPKYYETMAELLEALIQERKRQALDYKAYLAKIVALAKMVKKPGETSAYPQEMDTPALRALYDNLDKDIAKAVAVDKAVLNVKKANWKGNKIKEKEVRIAIKSVLGDDEVVGAVFDIVKAQREY